MINLSELARWGAVACGTTAAYAVARRVYDDVSVRVLERKTFNAKLNAFQQREAMRTLQRLAPDANGRGGWMVRADGTIINLDTHSRLDAQWVVDYVDPVRERVDTIERMLLVRRGNAEQLAELVPQEQVSLLPEFVDSAVMDAAPSYRRLVLGRTEHETVTADMASLVHVAVGGSSGWGKSIFLRWLVYQLVKSTDPVDLVLIDLEGATLAPFESCKRVLYPVADTEQDAVAVMTELTGELDKRKELYSAYPGVDSLYSYNEEAEEPIRPIVAVIDEATALLENKGVESHLRTLALRARKYGLWLVLAGQDWKANTLDTAIRNQLGARIQFKAMSKSQSRVLLNQPGAEELDVKGRAMAVLPGRMPFTFQAPMIKQSEIRNLRDGGPLYDMPITEAEAVELSEQEKVERVLELHGRGLSNRQIELAVFDYAGGRATERVRQIIESATT